MITIKNVLNLAGQKEDLTIPGNKTVSIDAQGKLTALPGVIDAHVHARVPGAEHKEDWKTFAKAAIKGGVTTVFDMPNNNPPCLSVDALDAKKILIDKQLEEVKIPLRYHLYLGGDEHHLEQIGLAKEKCIGIKIFMGCSTGNLCLENDQALEEAFKLAAKADILVAVHAEDREILRKNEKKYRGISDPSIHSKIRNPYAAAEAIKKALTLAERYRSRLYILHVSSQEELNLIRKAKARGVQVYAEATPHHLYLTENEYAKQGTKVQINPPLRSEEDRQALWEGLIDGTIDNVATDHAPHTLEEKNLPYPSSPSGVPGVEMLLPLLLNAVNEGKLNLYQLVKLLRTNVETIFRLSKNNDIVLVDLNQRNTVNEAALKSKCGWSPYHGMTLTGWPVYTILKGEVYGPL